MVELGERVSWVRGNADRELQLRRTHFDLGAACARVADESGYPEAAEWADFYLRSRGSDADAIAPFGPRDGRAAPAAPEP
ncbi:MAG TPA: hypothetical protein VHN18_13485 [Micromonosporaceae bacterium]|nr:hypothetical protein [Micromonosporaceae bacterium]